MSEARVSHLWDVDGNEYIDYVLGQGPMILGNSTRPVIEAVKQQVEKGFVYATQSENEVLAAEKICEYYPSAERVRWAETGSEEVHCALRLARSATGRRKIIRFEGHYHGWLDPIAWNHPNPYAELGPRENPTLRRCSEGQFPEEASNFMMLCLT